MPKMMKYTIEYDPQADAAYIRVKRAKVKDTIELEDGIFADVDNKRRFIGIEILNFTKRKLKLNELIAKRLANVAVAT